MIAYNTPYTVSRKQIKSNSCRKGHVPFRAYHSNLYHINQMQTNTHAHKHRHTQRERGGGRGIGRGREREGDRESHTYTHTHTHIYTYPYTPKTVNQFPRTNEQTWMKVVATIKRHYRLFPENRLLKSNSFRKGHIRFRAYHSNSYQIHINQIQINTHLHKHRRRHRHTHTHAHTHTRARAHTHTYPYTPKTVNQFLRTSEQTWMKVVATIK